MIENLKFILGRYDHYIESVQSKSNLYITLNTFILTGAVTLFAGFKNDLNLFLLNFLILVIIVSVVCMIYILIAVNPQTKKSVEDSIIFFGNVANKNDDGEYWKIVKNMSDKEFRKDLANQVQQVAIIVHKKHCRLKTASCLLILQFVLIGFWIVIFILKTKNNLI